MLQLFAKVMDGLVVFPQNMRRNIDKSFGLTFSQSLLLALTAKGLTREEAYKIVQTAAMKARNAGRNMKEEILESRDAVKYLAKDEIEKIFDIRNHLKNINVIFRRFGL